MRKMIIKRITLLLLFSLCEAKLSTFYVTPSNNTPCPRSNNCCTLDKYAQNPSLFVGHTDIILEFLKGVHTLSYSLTLSGYDLNLNTDSKLMFQGQQTSNSGGTVINLAPAASISISGFTHVHLLHINISCVNSTSNNFVKVENFASAIFQNSHFDGGSGVAFTNQVSISRRGNVTIQNCTIVGGGAGTIITHVNNLIIQNITILDTEKGIKLTAVKNGTIQNTKILNKGNQVYHFSITAFCCNSLLIQNCEVAGGQNGIGVYDTKKCKGSFKIQNTTVRDISLNALNLSPVNKGIIVNCTLQNNTVGIACMNSHVSIQQTNIIGNSFGLIIGSVNIWGFQVDNITASVDDCFFSENKEIGFLLINTPPTGIIISNSIFSDNQATPLTGYQSSFELKGNNMFRNNTARIGGGLALFNSTVIFSRGSITEFVDNKALEFGGAIYIATLSTVSFLFEALILAETYFDSVAIFDVDKILLRTNTLLRQSCFYSIKESDSEDEPTITFSNNKAIRGGFAIFGATVYTEDCNLTKPIFNYTTERSYNNSSQRSYEISSDPTRVCFCSNNTPECRNRTYFMLSRIIYPGESLNIPVSLAGYNFGSVAGNAYAKVLGQNQGMIMKSEQIQSVNLTECSNLTYHIQDPSKITDFKSFFVALTVQNQANQKQDETVVDKDHVKLYSERCSQTEGVPCTALLTTPVYINVTLKPCPLGFEINGEGRCDCDNTLNEVISSCEIQYQTINKNNGGWTGVDSRNESTSEIYWNRHCPRDYCNSTETSFDLNFPDQQCNSYRSGLLCGSCLSGYSLQLGGNRCVSNEQCNNNFLALLVVFAALGILLVAAIKLLDLTVTSGTVSGLIFYANIVWRNSNILFPQQNIGYYIITVPIAWINLDFGIETCFSENLDQLTKTGLQFLFPVYIWCIAGLIILICHFSTRATKLLGNNSVAVLATLFLLSYGKVFRNITDVFTFADMETSNNTNRMKVWALDGNIRYGVELAHIFLIVLALVFLILFLLPFTLTILLVPFLRAKSHLRPFRWINKLKPFFDTYYGPFKDKKEHQAWTGILLLSRVVTLIVFASTSTESPNANILLMTSMSVLLLMYSAMVGLLYKLWTLSLLENLYLLNLVLLGGGTLFYSSLTSQNDHQLNPVAATSVVVALILFIVTVIVSVAKRIIPMRGFREHVEEVVKSKAAVDEVGLETQQQDQDAPTVQVIEIPKYEYDPSLLRETLLETSH